MAIGSARFFLAAFTVIMADQLAKALVLSVKPYLPYSIIPPFLNISYAQNTGSAFGLLQGNNLPLILAGIAVAVLIIYYRKKLQEGIEAIAAAMILGGTLSNIIDRVLRGHVVDYIAIKGLPMFNVADSALTLGAALIITAYLKEKFRIP